MHLSDLDLADGDLTKVDELVLNKLCSHDKVNFKEQVQKQDAKVTKELKKVKKGAHKLGHQLHAI